MKHARADANYLILTKRVKLQHEKKPVSNLKSIVSLGFEQTFAKFIEIFAPRKIFLYGEKNQVETILVSIASSSNVGCFDLYLINKLTKSIKAERCTDIKFKLKVNCLSVTVKDLHLQ